MKASFKKRLVAYIIDFMLFTLVLTMIEYVIPVSSKKRELSDKIVEIEEKLLDGEITNQEYIKEYQTLLPEYDRENMALNICNLVFILGYFIVIPVISDGQTIGKKIMKIKIIKEKDGNLTIRDMIIRNFITTSLLQLMISSTFVYMVSSNLYFIVSLIISLLQIILVITTSFMIIYRKDKNGVQDLLTRTSVVEVK